MYPTNPKFRVPAGYFETIRIWRMCQGGMGYTGTWPDPGGIYDQAAIMLDAFSVLGAAEQDYRKR